MKSAFIILAHKNPPQLQRLLQRLQHPGIDCYVHLDGKADIRQWAECFAMPQVYPIRRRVKVNWAGYGTIGAALNSVREVVGAGKQYSFIHLISAQDYPLTDAGSLVRFFDARRGQEFLDVLPPEKLEPMMSKIAQYHFEDLRLPGKYRLARIFNRMMPPRRHPLGMKVYGGSLWWSLSMECAAYCVQYYDRHPAMRRFYKYTWGGDEFIFQTIILNSPYKDRVVRDHLRYIDWSEGFAHPKTFTPGDLPAILSSGKLLARKFDAEQSPGLLDAIDQHIGIEKEKSVV
ncbi:beta-1,6-N-acetylglucosaminyltransferase [Chitinophaga lutea]